MDELVLILTEHPRDMMALKFFYLDCIYTANFEEMRDVMARVLPAWNETEMEYGWVGDGVIGPKHRADMRVLIMV